MGKWKGELEGMGGISELENFYHGKKVFVTGHSGFKGTWLCKMLVNWGAEVKGYSLAPDTNPNVFNLSNIQNSMESVIGDIRDLDNMRKHYDSFEPDVVFHLAAQPIVIESYQNPHYTYETNVMGTVNLLECVRLAKKPPISVVVITTDKVYKNNEWVWGYRENEALDGFDPYSNSKSCAELAVHGYKNSFLDACKIPTSTTRAGNVIGGGDFSSNRIIPDSARAAMRNEKIFVRNPRSIRPYQHVLEPLTAYLLLAKRQADSFDICGYYNIGPDDQNCITTEMLVIHFCESWGNGLAWEQTPNQGPHEANFLKLDSSKIKNALGILPVWGIEKAISETVRWYQEYACSGNIPELMDKQIITFMEDFYEG